MANMPDALSYAEAALRKGLRKGAASFLDDFLRRYAQGAMTDGHGATALVGLREGMQAAWLTAWMLTGRDLAALVRKRFPVRGVARLDAGPYPVDNAPALTMPPPLPLPAEFRTWLETHTIAEGGTSAVAIPRSGAEWLAEHEATVNKWVPREYVDRYLRTRTPPLVRVTDQHLLDAARDMVAANVERGFGVAQTMKSLQRDFPSFSAHRLENIARTEGAVCFEHGRAARYMADGLVEGVEFSAVMDDRTTEECQWHNGRQYKLSDPDIPWPPLHYLCRSMMLPVLFNEKPDWNTEQPEPFERDGKMVDPRPLDGFGFIPVGDLPPNVTPDEFFRQAA